MAGRVTRIVQVMFVLGAAVVGALMACVFGLFASEPYFPTIPGWVQYPEPWPMTVRKLTGNLALALVVGGLVAVLVRQSRQLRAPEQVRAAVRLLVWSGAAFIVLSGWQLTGRDAIGSEPMAVGPVTWPLVTCLVGTCLVYAGVAVGAADIGLRAELRSLLGRPATVLPRRQVLVGRWLVAAGVMAWMWVTPWRTTDRLQLSILATIAVAVWLARSHAGGTRVVVTAPS